MLALRLPNPTSPINAVPNSQTAAGTGTWYPITQSYIRDVSTL